MIRSNSLKCAVFTIIHHLLKVSCELKITTDFPPKDSIQKIPKVFHTIWMDFGRGPEPFPEYKANIEKLMKLHPGWTVKNWNEKEIEDLIKTEYPQFYSTYMSYDVKIKKHDFSRPIILHKYGGLYLDHDSNPLRNVEEILKSYDIVFGNELPFRFFVNNAFLASVPQHNFWLFFLESMCRPGESRKFVLSATGPAKMSDVIKEYEKNYSTDGIKIYSNEFFYPFCASRKYADAGKTDDELRKMLPKCYVLQQFRSTWR